MHPSCKRKAITSSEEGFSLIELVVVIAVLAILSTFGFSYLMKFIDYVKFNVAKAVLTNNHRECVAGKSPSKTSIPDVIFSMLGSEDPIQCSSIPITASILNQCCLTIDTQTGEKFFSHTSHTHSFWSTRDEDLGDILNLLTAHGAVRALHHNAVLHGWGFRHRLPALG